LSLLALAGDESIHCPVNAVLDQTAHDEELALESLHLRIEM
jgi:hypothetical protein